MAVLTNAILQTQCNAVVDALDAGTGTPTIVIQTAVGATLATVNLDATAAFGAATAASPSVATATNLPRPFTASGTGTAAKYIARNRSGAEVWYGLCGPEAGKLQLDNYNLATGQGGNITALTWSQPTGSE